MLSNRLASDTVKLVDFDGVRIGKDLVKGKNQQKIKVSVEHLYPIT